MQTPKPSAQTLRCGQCGAPFELRGGPRTQVIVCAYCDSATDLTDPSYRILWRYHEKVKYTPVIPLGTRGTLHETKLDCIGFVRRSTTVDGETFGWSEYLLYNPFKGYRWLVEDEGVWTLVQVSNALPTLARSGDLIGDTPPPDTIKYMGRKFSHSQTSDGRVDYAIGEFYWAISVGDTTANSDYQSGHYTLSAEVSPDEITWSAGERIDADSVLSAFGLGVPKRSETRPADGITYKSIWITWLLYCIAAFVITGLASTFSKDTLVLSKSFDYTANAQERSFVTDVFQVSGSAPANVEVRAKGNIDNRWCAYHVSLINDDTGEAYDVGIDTSWYHGVEDGEGWTEGSQESSSLIAHVPPGRYYLFIEPESGTGNDPETYRADQPNPGPLVFSYLITVRGDVVDWKMFMLVFALLFPCPIFMNWRLARRLQR